MKPTKLPAIGSDRQMVDWASDRPLPPAMALPPAGGSKPATNEFSPAVLLAALRRRWLVALVLSLGAAAVAAFAAPQFMPASCTARTVVRVEPRKAFLFNMMPDRVDPKSQVAIVKSRVTLNSALNQPGIAELPSVQRQSDPFTWLEQKIQAEFSASDILKITLGGDNPTEVTALLNAIRDAFLKEFLDKDYHDWVNHRDKLRKFCQDKEDELTELRQAVRNAAQRIGSPDPVAANTIYNQAQDDLRFIKRDRSLLAAQIGQAQAVFEQHRKQRPPEPSGETLEDTAQKAVTNDPVSFHLSTEVRKLETEVANLRQRATNPELQPDVQAKQTELQKAQADLKARLETIRKDATEKLREQYQRRWQDQLTAEQELLEREEGNRRVLDQEVTRREAELNELTQAMIVLRKEQDRLEQTMAPAKKAAEELEKLQVESQAPPRTKVLEEAVITQIRDPKGQWKWMALPALGAFALVLFGVTWLEARTGRVNGSDDVAAALGIGLVGALPVEPATVRRNLAQPGRTGRLKPSDMFTDAVDATCAMVLNPARAGSPQIVLVASALAGEGKTTLVSHLAMGLARAGYRTLLIDADLRNPSVHRRFGMPLQPGLGEFLCSTAELGAVIQDGPVKGLSVIPGGHCGPRTLVAFARQRLPGLFQRLKQDYQVILVDTPPVLPLPDTLLLAELADAVVLAVRRDHSRLAAVRAAYERLSMFPCRLLGAIVNGEGGLHYGSYYSYRYTKPHSHE